MKAFRRRTAGRRVPISGILELTSRCNLRCVHCYLGPQEEQRGKRDEEMDTARVKAVVDDLAANGCLYLVITGGDPMVRKDFPEIYCHAREQGLIVTVFCDGVLVTGKIVELFREIPPFSVEISLYGATAGTYEAVTRVPGSFPRCLRGIRLLLEGGVAVNLKTVLMSINRHELADMRRMAEDLGVKFRVDSAIFPCLGESSLGESSLGENSPGESSLGENSHQPLDLRVDPQAAVALELEDARQAGNWLDHIAEQRDQAPSEYLYSCGAGLTNFYVDPFGYVSPCLMTTHYRYSLAERDFGRLWGHELARLREKKPRGGYACGSCEMRAACAGCPAFNYLENGAEDVRSEYVCETTRARWQALQADGTVTGDARAPAKALPVLAQHSGDTQETGRES